MNIAIQVDEEPPPTGETLPISPCLTLAPHRLERLKAAFAEWLNHQQVLQTTQDEESEP